MTFPHTHTRSGAAHTTTVEGVPRSRNVSQLVARLRSEVQVLASLEACEKNPVADGLFLDTLNDITRTLLAINREVQPKEGVI